MQMDVNFSKSALRDVLRFFIGRHAMPVEMVSRETGIPERRIYSHLGNDGTCPSGVDLQAYARVFGPQFLNALFGPLGFVCHRAEPETFCMHGFLTHHLSFAREWSVVIEDGVIDHQEQKKVVPMMRNLSDMTASYALALERGEAA